MIKPDNEDVNGSKHAIRTLWMFLLALAAIDISTGNTKWPWVLAIAAVVITVSLLRKTILINKE